MDKIKILGIAGSLRKDSYNKAVLNAAKDMVPEGATLEIYENLGEIPPFNQDLENDPPDIIVKLKEKIRAADAILFSTPEYNYSIPGVLKNAIDWASRPYGDSAWERKPVAIMSASPANVGAARSQYHLRQSFVFLNMLPINMPEVIIPNVSQKVSENGEMTDEHTKGKIKELLQALVDWTIKLKKAGITK